MVTETRRRSTPTDISRLDGSRVRFRTSSCMPHISRASTAPAKCLRGRLRRARNPVCRPDARATPYIDTRRGQSRLWLRPNPPHADGLIRASVFPPSLNPDTPANAPFMGTLQLYGCNMYQGGQYYRLLYSYMVLPRCRLRIGGGMSIHSQVRALLCTLTLKRRDGTRSLPARWLVPGE